MTRNDQIITLYSHGFTSSFIAKRIGLPVSTVATVASRSKVRVGKWGRNPDRARTRFAPETHRAVVADRYSGLSYSEISARHGISPKTCWRLVNEVAL